MLQVLREDTFVKLEAKKNTKTKKNGDVINTPKAKTKNVRNNKILTEETFAKLEDKENIKMKKTGDAIDTPDAKTKDVRAIINNKVQKDLVLLV